MYVVKQTQIIQYWTVSLAWATWFSARKRSFKNHFKPRKYSKLLELLLKKAEAMIVANSWASPAVVIIISRSHRNINPWPHQNPKHLLRLFRYYRHPPMLRTKFLIYPTISYLKVTGNYNRQNHQLVIMAKARIFRSLNLQKRSAITIMKVRLDLAYFV